MNNLKYFFSVLTLTLVLATSCQYQEDDFHTAFEEQELNNHNHSTSEAGIPITSYRIDGNQLDKIKDYSVNTSLKNYQEDYARHLEMWETFIDLIPFEERTNLKEFVIVYGAQDLYGYVEPIKDDNGQWKMGLAIDVIDGPAREDENFIYTLIHEYAHMMTLDSDQVDQSISENNCDNFYPFEGCSESNSYINLFYDQYWEEIFDDFLDAEAQDDIYDFYDQYPDHFVTDYAATNPGEDIAETFAVYVTSNNLPAANSIADEKVRFMDNFPELVDLRNHIRGGTAALPIPGTWKRSKCTHFHSIK